MIAVEEIREGRTSRKTSVVGMESVVAWLGARNFSFCGTRISQDDTKKLSEVVGRRVEVFSLHDPIHFSQLVESQSIECRVEWEQWLAQLVGALLVKIFPGSVIYPRPQTLCAMSHGSRV